MSHHRRPLLDFAHRLSQEAEAAGAIYETDSYYRQFLSQPRSIVNESLWNSIAAQWSIPLLRGVHAKRVLLPGNGVSLLPHVCAYLGMEAVALELSPLANRFVREVDASGDLLLDYFRENREVITERGNRENVLDPDASRARMEREHVPRGTVTVLDQDVFAYAPGGVFDAIIDGHFIASFRGFLVDQGLRIVYRELTTQYAQWLRPGGVCIVCATGMTDRDDLESAFHEAGFEPIGAGCEAMPPLPEDHAPLRRVHYIHGMG